MIPDPNITIVVVLDRSGSMESKKAATISAFNEYLGSIQKSYPDVGMTLVQFNTAREARYNGEPVKNCHPLTLLSYQPDGGTALHDAVFESIRDTEKRICVHTKVLFCVLTDGEENSSREHTLHSLKALIAEKEATKNWTFTYLGANQDAWAVGMAMGIPVGNVMNYHGTPQGTIRAVRGMAISTDSFLAGGGQQVSSFYGREHADEGAETGAEQYPPVTNTTVPPVVNVDPAQDSTTWPGKRSAEHTSK